LLLIPLPLPRPSSFRAQLSGCLGAEDFSESASFGGSRPGWVFKRDRLGLGYYRDAGRACGASATPSSVLPGARPASDAQPCCPAGARARAGGGGGAHPRLLGAAPASEVDKPLQSEAETLDEYQAEVELPHSLDEGPRVRRLGQTIGLYAEQEEDAYQEMEKNVRAICPGLEDLNLVPDELRGIIFLVNANLDPSERATVVAGLHDWKIELVIEKLKYVWADKDLLARDSLEFDEEDLEALEAYAVDAEVYAQDARRTFTEAKKLLAEAAKNRSGYFPVVGIGQIPEKQFKDQKTIDAARPPKGKGKGIKCLICQGPHRAVDCPKRGNTGNDGNNVQMAAQGFVDAEDDDENNYGNEGNAPEEGQAGWVHEEMIGYAIIDMGASKSMIGIDLAAAIQGAIIEETGEDHVTMDYAKKTRATYAGGEKGQSIGKFGFEHPVALVEGDNKLWFDLVETKSPMFLGLDYLEKAGADLIKERSALVFADGREENLTMWRWNLWKRETKSNYLRTKGRGAKGLATLNRIKKWHLAPGALLAAVVFERCGQTVARTPLLAAALSGGDDPFVAALLTLSDAWQLVCSASGGESQAAGIWSKVAWGEPPHQAGHGQPGRRCRASGGEGGAAECFAGADAGAAATSGGAACAPPARWPESESDDDESACPRLPAASRWKEGPRPPPGPTRVQLTVPAWREADLPRPRG
ncbi:unnamed protein product, partial [Prorocentrum cordatum]